jgi:hypothetical protein
MEEWKGRYKTYLAVHYALHTDVMEEWKGRYKTYPYTGPWAGNPFPALS